MEKKYHILLYGIFSKNLAKCVLNTNEDPRTGKGTPLLFTSTFEQCSMKKAVNVFTAKRF